MFHNPQFEQMQNHFDTGETRPLKTRLDLLTKLEMVIKSDSDKIAQALYQDLRKPEQESLISEVAFLIEEIGYTKKHLKSWMMPTKVKTPLALLPGKSTIHYDPLGVVLIIGPWNYPFQLALAPLIGAIAAGNCAVIKPSELTPHTSKIIVEIIKKVFRPEHVQVVEGGVDETTELLKLKWNHIFFTGSTSVGQIIMKAAAENLIPVTLELGGKSPVIVTKTSDLNLAARRIVWAKFYNTGQTCVAPDYLYVQSSVKNKLVELLKEEIQKQFGKDPQKSRDLTRIINVRNHQRLCQMIDNEKVVFGGDVDEDDLCIAPTLLEGVSWQDPVMQEEIFGPILPILEFDDLKSLIALINKEPRPLSAYLFSQATTEQTMFTEKLHFGGGCINDLIVHLSHPELPFGGLGSSGIGSYHGHTSFLTFSHQKSLMLRYSLFDFSARYAPYSQRKLNFLKKIFGLS